MLARDRIRSALARKPGGNDRPALVAFITAGYPEPSEFLTQLRAVAGAKRWAAANRGKRILIGLSGRGDKDMPILAQYASDTAEVRRHAAA